MGSFVNERAYPRRGRPVIRWVIYCAGLIDFYLCAIWFLVPITATINAIRISGLILAVILGVTTFLRRRLSFIHWRKTGSAAAAIDAAAGASSFFTIAVLLGLGHRLSSDIAIGIFMLLSSAVMLFSGLFHRRDEKPWWIAIDILMLLGTGAFGIFLIYAHPSFTFTIFGIIVGFIGGLVAPLIDRHLLGRERNPEDTEAIAPRAG